MNDKDKQLDMALTAVSLLAHGLRDFGKTSKANHALELAVRDACGLKPWPLFSRWLTCEDKKRGPAFSMVHLFVVALRKELPKEEADKILRKAFSKQNKAAGGHFFGHFVSESMRKDACAFCSEEVESYGLARKAFEAHGIHLCNRCLSIFESLSPK